MAKASTLTCELCGQDGIHSIKTHLTKSHGADSGDSCTIEEYKSRFPRAAVFSEEARKRIAAAKASAEKGKPMTSSTGVKGELHELFKLGKNKAARTPDGKPIPVEICQQEGFEELIPDYNNGYVYNMENLKNALACISMNEPLFVYGPSGVGKSTLFKQVCHATRRRYVRFQHNQDSQVSQAVGQWVVVPKEDDHGNIVSVTEYQLGPLALAMIHGWVYNADEIDRAPSGFNSVYQAVLEGEPLFIGDAPEEYRIIRPHKDFRFVATGNTNGSGDETGMFSSTIQQDAATIERFTVDYVQYLQPAEEVAMIKAALPLTDDQANKLVNFANKVRERHPEDFDLTIGNRVLLRSAKMGLARGSFLKGIELAFTNRLPSDQRMAANEAAQRLFGS